jgi:hypothetical protein
MDFLAIGVPFASAMFSNRIWSPRLSVRFEYSFRSSCTLKRMIVLLVYEERIL